MAVFISYSHDDSDFVDLLASHLIAGNANVWVDRWELHVGDSLRARIEEAMEQAAAILFVLSPASLQSEWCQRELSAGLVRELDERRVIVLPVLVADCEIPLFLRDKMHADFRTDFDAGLRQVRESLARVTSASLGRIDEAEGHIDWSTRWDIASDGEAVVMQINVLQQGADNPYSVFSQVTVTLNEVASQRHLELAGADAEDVARQIVLESFAEVGALDEFRLLLDDSEPETADIEICDAGANLGFSVRATSRRMGEDTGRDVLVPIGRVLRELAGQTRDRLRPLEREQREAVLAILRRYRPGLGTP